MAWSLVCSPKSKGGQGIINLELWNIITMLKFLWNICKKYDNMWVKGIQKVYLKDQDVMTAHVPNTCSWTLRRIFDLREQVQTIWALWDRMLT